MNLNLQKTTSLSFIHRLASYLNALKYVLKGPWDDSLLGRRLRHPLHGERLATSSLSVSKDGPVVAFSDTLSAEVGSNKSTLTLY